MRHKKSGRKFNRTAAHRRAMFRNMVGNLVLHERIETTEAKAMELRGVAETLLTKALRLGDDLTVDVTKLGDAEKARVVAARVAARRLVAEFLPRKFTKTIAPAEKAEPTFESVDLVAKLFDKIAPRYIERVKAGKGGGYTRVIKLTARRGDNANLAIIEFV